MGEANISTQKESAKVRRLRKVYEEAATDDHRNLIQQMIDDQLRIEEEERLRKEAARLAREERKRERENRSVNKKDSAKVRSLKELLEQANSEQERGEIQKLIDDQVRHEQVENRFAKRVATKTANYEEQHRKDDTRRKIITGGMCLTHGEKNPEFKAQLDRLIHEHVKEDERYLFPEYWPDAQRPERRRNTEDHEKTGREENSGDIVPVTEQDTPQNC